MIYSLFYCHNFFCTLFWVSSFNLSVNIMVYQFMVTCIENFTSKVEVWGLLDGKKRFKIVIIFSGCRQRSREERNAFVKVDVIKYKCSFTCIAGFLTLKPFHNYSLCSVCILPQPAFYSRSAVCILHTVCILPLVRSLHFTLTDSCFIWING